MQYSAEMHPVSHVPLQLDMYSKKFDEIQGTVSKSNTVYSGFKQDMDKVSFFFPAEHLKSSSCYWSCYLNDVKVYAEK